MTTIQLTHQQLEAARALKSLTRISNAEIEKKHAAGIELIESLTALSEIAGFELVRDKIYTALLFSEERRVILTLNNDEDVILQNSAKAVVPLALEYDRISKKWVGTDVDSNIEPSPGQPLPRKSAVVVLAEAAVSAVQNLEQAKIYREINVQGLVDDLS